MKTIVGESGRCLDIDLSSRSYRVFSPAEEDLLGYLGGKGLGTKLYYDRLGGADGTALREVDPLGPENILAFMMGSFAGTGAPCSARFAGVTKSPLTGIMVSSSCGGPFGLACKTAGWDGILVSGRASSPLVLRIDEDGVRFEEAEGLWGLETGPAQERLVDNPRQGALVIGPAGENGVLYAVIRSGNRYLGRGGMGAVMGAKNLKAVVATGRAYRIEPADPERYARLNAKARKHINRNPFVLSYRAYGTNYGVNPGVDRGYAPVRNFRDRTDERCRSLSGEAMAERYATEHAACAPCAVLCGHKGTYPDGQKRHIPEYETIGLWGGNIMNFDPDLVAVWNDRMGELGLDTISCGATASWAMEAAEKGLRPSELAFGRTDNIARILDDIAHRRGEGAELALGSRRLAEKYGGLEFAAQVKGMEMAAYDPRGGWGQGLNYAVANRGGCHLNAYPIALEAIFGFIPQYSRLSKASWVDFFEDLFTAVNSTQTCQFSAFGYLLEPPVAKYTPKPLLKLAMTLLPEVAQSMLDWSCLSGLVGAITGRRVTPRDFRMAGRRAHVLERRMNCLMGVTAADDTLPGRFLTEGKTRHPVDSVVPIEPLVKAYYRKKGYGPDGVPTARTLARLGIGAPAGSRDASRAAAADRGAPVGPEAAGAAADGAAPATQAAGRP
ncbi:MAG TPA: aldehyde ferredoxin oxidoreductase family protein [Spirochaetales bacterium]|nr:aldehyde ferredoxin oxidoreductase family protein [Spirochaetales bacterium]